MISRSKNVDCGLLPCHLHTKVKRQAVAKHFFCVYKSESCFSGHQQCMSKSRYSSEVLKQEIHPSTSNRPEPQELYVPLPRVYKDDIQTNPFAEFPNESVIFQNLKGIFLPRCYCSIYVVLTPTVRFDN